MAKMDFNKVPRFAELPVNLQGAAIAGWQIDKANLKYVNHPLVVTRTLLRTLHRGAPLPGLPTKTFDHSVAIEDLSMIAAV